MRIFHQFRHLKKKPYWGNHFWAQGYCVDTVGLDEDMVRKYVRYGASPRAAQAFILGGKVTALLAGRYNVAFEDLRAVALAALRHRILLNFEGQAEGVSTDGVVAEVLQAVSEE